MNADGQFNHAVSAELKDPRARHQDVASAQRETDDSVLPYECYCGLGPGCPLWDQTTPEERVACSADERMTAQYFWRHWIAGAFGTNVTS